MKLGFTFRTGERLLLLCREAQRQEAALGLEDYKKEASAVMASTSEAGSVGSIVRRAIHP